MRDLVAVRPLVYASRRLQVGDYFTTRTNNDARILVAIGKARGQSDGDAAPLAPEKSAHQLGHDANGKKGGSKAPLGDKAALNKLRADYQEVVKKKPFAGWNAAELQRRIDEALGS